MALFAGLGLIVFGAWQRYFAGFSSPQNSYIHGLIFLAALVMLLVWARTYRKWRWLIAFVLLIMILTGSSAILARELGYRTIADTAECSVLYIDERERTTWVGGTRLLSRYPMSLAYYQVTWDCAGNELESITRPGHALEEGQRHHAAYDLSGHLALRPTDEAPALVVPAASTAGALGLLFLLRHREGGASQGVRDTASAVEHGQDDRDAAPGDDAEPMSRRAQSPVKPHRAEIPAPPTPSGVDDADRDAAQAGDTEAMVRLSAQLSEQGSTKVALIWLRKAFVEGHAAAATALARYYETQGDLRRAKDTYRVAAQRGDPEGMVGYVDIQTRTKGQGG